jgi:hypothetical protein
VFSPANVPLRTLCRALHTIGGKSLSSERTSPYTLALLIVGHLWFGGWRGQRSCCGCRRYGPLEACHLGPTATNKHPACFDTGAGERTPAQAAMLSLGFLSNCLNLEKKVISIRGVLDSRVVDASTKRRASRAPGVDIYICGSVFSPSCGEWMVLMIRRPAPAIGQYISASQ